MKWHLATKQELEAIASFDVTATFEDRVAATTELLKRQCTSLKRGVQNDVS